MVSCDITLTAERSRGKDRHEYKALKIENMHYIAKTTLLILLVQLASCSSLNKKAEERSRVEEKDICIYTATASGILAALAAKDEGRSVVIVEPSRWVGGILGAGIKPSQDCVNLDAVGGTTREIMKSLGIKNPLPDPTLKDLRAAMMAGMSPLDIRADFLEMLKQQDIEVIYDHRIQRVSKTGTAIKEAIFDLAPFDEFGLPQGEAVAPGNLVVKAKVFIDASYEGELMARAGVSFASGRESASDYGEEYAGVQPPSNLTPIDPYVIPGDKNSGLVPLVEEDHGKPVGASDYHTQAYNFRFYVTDDPAYKAEFGKPENYSPADYELVGRYVEYLVKTIPDKTALYAALRDIFPGWLNAGEYNYQRNSLITMAPVGVSHLYINGDYETKARVWKYHQDYLKGLHEFLSTDARVPEEFRQETARLGLDSRHHPETHGWPHQLYIRVSRRMIGSYTITAADVYNKTTVSDPIGLAQYGIDTYPARRVVVEKDGKVYVALEGKMFVGGGEGPTHVPYPVSYRSITPRKSECTNLLVPVCFSASHLGYASARMEPVFMICGESAGIAASQAINENCSVQDIDARVYHRTLVAKGQRLRWPVNNVEEL